VIEAQEMLVSFEPNWTGGEFPYGHFEFRSPFEPSRRIPVSETGYRSHFAPMAEIEAYESAEEFARAFVMAVIKNAGRGKSQATNAEQLSLF
jgi:hypothetical protein